MPVLSADNKNSQRLNAVLNFAHANFHNELTLDSLADVACLSKYYFLRLFNKRIGESPVGFLKRIRLERAACLLARAPSQSISNIGLTCGYSTSQLFSRSFAERFGHCPRQFRAMCSSTGARRQGSNNVESWLDRSETAAVTYDWLALARQINIVKNPPIKVAYVRNFGNYGGADSGASEAISSIVWWAKKQGLWRENTPVIGVTWDYSSHTPKDMCRFDACVPIPANYSDTSDVSVQVLPGGTYATMKASLNRDADILPMWKWFDLSVATFPKFRHYQSESNVGPWYEVYKSQLVDGKSETVLCTHLHPRTCPLDYPEYREMVTSECSNLCEKDDPLLQLAG